MNKASRGSKSRQSNTGKGGTTKLMALIIFSVILSLLYTVAISSDYVIFFLRPRCKNIYCCFFSEDRLKALMVLDHRRRRPSRGNQRCRCRSMSGYSDNTLLLWVHGQIRILYIKPHACTQMPHCRTIHLTSVLCHLFTLISPQIFQT